MTTRATVERHLKDALNNLYSPAHLETHPLTQLLQADLGGRASRAQALRALLIAEIEGLRPEEAIPFGRPEWLPYRILSARYIEGHTVEDICDQISLSRTTFYRYHAEALEALANRVWRRTEQQAPKVLAAPPAAANPASTEAARMAALAPREWAQPATLLQETIELLADLATRRGIRLETQLEPLPLVYVNTSMLRQAFISLLTAALEHVATDCLWIRSGTTDERCALLLEPLAATLDEAAFQARERLAVTSAILAAYGGEVRLQSLPDGEQALYLALRCQRPRTVLVIDDHEEAVTLYRRYLREASYVVTAAPSAEDALEAIARLKPDLILLDLLMPGRDGWRILQQLTHRPAAEAIPVIVCSVLSQPELALSLGAAAVLQKPIAQEQLLAALQALYPETSPGV